MSELKVCGKLFDEAGDLCDVCMVSEAEAALAVKEAECDKLSGDLEIQATLLEGEHKAFAEQALQLAALREAGDALYSLCQMWERPSANPERDRADMKRWLSVTSPSAPEIVGQVVKRLEKIAGKYKQTQDMMRRHGWKYENSENAEQKMTFSVYTDLVESCHEADALLALFSGKDAP